MQANYPKLSFDSDRDDFVLWVRWVSMEKPENPKEPSNQGIRVECQIDRNPVFGPTVIWRSQLDRPLYFRTNRQRSIELMRAASQRKTCDIQLIIHGSVANAPYLALHHLRDYQGEAIDSMAIDATPLLQLQPSTPGDQWHVAAQASIRVVPELLNNRTHLKVVR